MEMFTDPLLPGWKPEDVVWEVALKEGGGLQPIRHHRKGTADKRRWTRTGEQRTRAG